MNHENAEESDGDSVGEELNGKRVGERRLIGEVWVLVEDAVCPMSAHDCSSSRREEHVHRTRDMMGKQG